MRKESAFGSFLGLLCVLSFVWLAAPTLLPESLTWALAAFLLVATLLAISERGIVSVLVGGSAIVVVVWLLVWIAPQLYQDSVEQLSAGRRNTIPTASPLHEPR